MLRRHWLLLVLALSVIFDVWVMVGRIDGHRPTGTLGPVAPMVSNTQLKLTREEAHQLESKLMSRNEATYRSAWAHSQIPPIAPAGITIEIEASSFVSQQNFGSVRAVGVLPGKAPQSWQLLLQVKNGYWSVVTIREVS